MQLPDRCANLGPATQDRRLRLGIAFFTVTVIVAVVMVKLNAHPALRWALCVPFFCATVHIGEAMLKTCPLLAARGLREQGNGAEPIADPRERSRVRGNGRRLLVSSALIALSAAALCAQFSPA